MKLTIETTEEEYEGWLELEKPYEGSLNQKLISAYEEQANKIHVGDWLVSKERQQVFKVITMTYNDYTHYTKLSPQLQELLNKETT